MRIHFISIGGAAMHNLAIALHKNGITVSGSDDEIFEPSKSRLAKHGLLPPTMGWNSDLINSDLDAVILGMHARKDNPELLKAMELNIKIYSYPEYIYEMSKSKTRVVIAGSHGKTTITSMVMHVLRHQKLDFDYLAGAQLEGFDTMVKLTDAPVIVLEGDEYLSSPIDLRPKFSWYLPQVAIISGIAWDHINVFPTFDNYVEQFKYFIDSIEKGGALIYFEQDTHLKNLSDNSENEISKIPYNTPEHVIEEGKSYIIYQNEKIAVNVFGEHNLQNLEGARLICEKIGIESKEFYAAIQTFKGAAKRLELIAENKDTIIYKDFAHSPSKLKATVTACKKQYKNKKLVACMELHTFSSLNKEFLLEYEGSMNEADEAIVYYSPKTIEHKKLETITEDEVKSAFANDKLKIFTNSQTLQSYLKEKEWKDCTLLLMSSGNFDGIDLNQFSNELIAL